MSFNRQTTNRLVASGPTSTSSRKQNQAKENVSPAARFTVLKNFSKGTFGNASDPQMQLDQPRKLQKTAKMHGLHRMPLQEARDFKLHQLDSNRARSLSHKSKPSSTKAKQRARQPLTLSVASHHDYPQDVDQPEGQEGTGAGPVDNFDLIRQLISPAADDTRQFLEQITLQLKGLPMTGSSEEALMLAQSQRITPQPHPLKALDLSHISDQNMHQYMSSHEEDAVFPRDDLDHGTSDAQSVPLCEDSYYLADMSQGLISAATVDQCSTNTQKQANAPRDDKNLTSLKNSECGASYRSGSNGNRSYRASLLNTRPNSIKAQFDYASLIDRRHSTKQLTKASKIIDKKEVSHKETQELSCNDQQQCQTFSNEGQSIQRPTSLAALKATYVASLDQLISQDDKVAEQWLQNSLKACNDRIQNSEEQQIATSRFKNQKTASVATFGQQGKVDAIGGSCTSPTALSPPSLQETNASLQLQYWRMEERQLESEQTHKGVQSTKSSHQKRKGQQPASSVVNKYISAAQERHKRTINLNKPVLVSKRENSLSSHQSLRISTQPSECLSNRSRRIGPSSTTTTLSQLSQGRRPKRAFQNQQASTKQQTVHLQTEVSQSGEHNSTQSLEQSAKAIRKVPRNLHASSKAKSRNQTTISAPSSKERSSSAAKSAGSQGSKIRLQTKPAVPRYQKLRQNSVNILHSKPQTKIQKSGVSRVNQSFMNRSRSLQRRKSKVKNSEISDTQSQNTVIKCNNLSRQSISSIGSRKQNTSQSRCSSVLSRKSPVPELDLNRTFKTGEFNNPNNLDQEDTFIDQTEDDDPAIANLRKFQTRLLYVRSKIDYYARLVTLRRVRDFSHHERPQATAYLKAGRCLCLLLKSFTCMDSSFRQIKEDELFEDWSKIQQYLNSEQGEKQIKKLVELGHYCEQFNKFCDRRTLLGDLRKSIFKQTLGSAQGGVNEIDLESPRVKTGALKPIFCLAYFTMTFVQIQDQIFEQLSNIQRIKQTQEEQVDEPYPNSDSSPEKNGRLSTSPDVNRLGITNIALNTTIQELSSQQTVHIAAPNELSGMQIEMLSAQSKKTNGMEIGSSIMRCAPDASTSPSIVPSSFLNQAQKIDMFGSHFKATAALASDESVINSANKVEEPPHPQQLNLKQQQSLHPISSIEDPSNSSFLNQSGVSQHQNAQFYKDFDCANSSSLGLNSRPETRLSNGSSQVGYKAPYHNISNDAGQTSPSLHMNSSLIIGNGIVPEKQFSSVCAYQPPMTMSSHNVSHQTSEFTFYQSQKHSQRQATQLSSQCTTPPLQDLINAPMTQVPEQQESEDPKSPTWQPNAYRNMQESPSVSERDKMTDIIRQERNAPGIKVNDLLMRVKASTNCLEPPQQQTPQEQEFNEMPSIEKAFQQFYQVAPRQVWMDTLQPVSEENTLAYDDIMADEIPSERALTRKQQRTTSQILSSIKKRRLNDQNRLCGQLLDNVADKIIEQCRITIQSTQAVSDIATSAAQTEVDSERHFMGQAQPSDADLQCLVSHKNTCLTRAESEQHQLTPETPPFNGMKRVFNSSDHEAQQHLGIEQHHDDEEKAAFDTLDPEKVAFQGFSCQAENNAQFQNEEEEGDLKFTTLEAAPQVSHIASEQKINIDQQQQSGRSQN